MEQNAEPPLTDADAVSRELPARIVIPPIRGEMVHLRPAAVEDLPRMDELGAYCGASRITGKDMQAERRRGPRLGPPLGGLGGGPQRNRCGRSRIAPHHRLVDPDRRGP